MPSDKETDRELLARLHALKASPVRLEPTHPARRVAKTEDDIARRFLELRPAFADQGSNAPAVDRSVTATEPERSENIEDVVEELRSEIGQGLSQEDEEKVRVLLAQAREALGVNDAQTEVNPGTMSPIPRPNVNSAILAEHQRRGLLEGGDARETGDKSSSADEDAEAAELLAQILDDVRLQDSESSDGEARPEPSPRFENDDRRLLLGMGDFPNVPSDKPVSPSNSVAGMIELPSVPKGIKAHASAKSQKKKYTDAEVETWCEICQANAEVRCLGCDGDLYCLRCWKEGHTGPEAGVEERMHRCVQYNKPRLEATASA